MCHENPLHHVYIVRLIFGANDSCSVQGCRLLSQWILQVRLSWTKHTAQEELCHLARFAISLAALALTCKAVSQNIFRPKHCKFIKRLYGSTWQSAPWHVLSTLQTARTLPRALARAPHALQLPSPFPAVFLAPFPCKCSGKQHETTLYHYQLAILNPHRSVIRLQALPAVSHGKWRRGLGSSGNVSAKLLFHSTHLCTSQQLRTFHTIMHDNTI